MTHRIIIDLDSDDDKQIRERDEQVVTAEEFLRAVKKTLEAKKKKDD